MLLMENLSIRAVLLENILYVQCLNVQNDLKSSDEFVCVLPHTYITFRKYCDAKYEVYVKLT